MSSPKLVIGFHNFHGKFNPSNSRITAILRAKLKKFTGIADISMVMVKNHPHLTFDILVYGTCTGNLARFGKIKARVKLLWAQEHANRMGVPRRLANQIADFEVGYIHGGVKDTATTVRIPNWMFYWDFLYDESKDLDRVLNAKPRSMEGRQQHATFIARNPHGNRAGLVKDLQRIVRTDCPGKVGKNMPSVEQITGITRGGGVAKLAFLTDYLINLCPENAKIEGYVTEKLMQACVAGCIPIYWGHPRMELGIINPDRVLWCASKGSIGPSTKSTINKLLGDRELLKEFFNQPVF